MLNQLYRMTQLQTSFAVNFLALDEGRPRQRDERDDPSGPHKSMMTRFVETMLQRPETIAPENRFYTQEMLDAVRVEDAAKPNFTKALEAHGIHLGVPKKPFYRRT